MNGTRLVHILITMSLLSISAAVATEPKDYECTARVDISQYEEVAAGYACFSDAKLKNQAPAIYPYANFAVFIDSDRVGRLKRLNSDSLEQPRANTNLPTWSESTSFYKSNKDLVPLNLADAKVIFGPPIKKGKTRDFYVFDVEGLSELENEKQLYHIDIKFDNLAVIESYRVRGIGINNPKWISAAK